MSQSNAEQVVYVGSGAGELLGFSMDRATGALRRCAQTRAGECPSFVAFHPERPLAYAIDENAGVVRSFAVSNGGELSEIGCVDSGGAGPAYISIDRAGSFAFVANYGGGTIAVFAISRTGALESAAQVVQAGKHPHSIAADVDNRRVSVPVLGEDAVLQFAFDPARGLLEPASVPRTRLPSGSGPRHIDFHPTLPVAYVVHEHSSELTAYAITDGEFTPLVTCSTLPGAIGFPGNTGSDVHVAPSGRFVYASNRGHDSIAIFALDQRGLPSPTAHAATLGSTPRNFCLTRDGSLMLVANLRSDSVTTFAVDTETGALSPLSTTEGIPMPFWVGARAA
ncbi:MAG TPA: lactonase family protein [Polyangiaceae bacterium]|jgi:6-phosphogluconolactonase|nr:lactonase family protein [Polyangiaceae bacterium]